MMQIDAVMADRAVREEEATPPVRKLFGKEWIESHAGEFDPDVVSITEAGRQLSAKSKTAPDCAKPLSAGHCINLLRDLNRWGKKPIPHGADGERKWTIPRSLIGWRSSRKFQSRKPPRSTT